jgi:hypothetical protein
VHQQLSKVSEIDGEMPGIHRFLHRTLHNVAPDNGQLEPDQSVYHQPAPGLDYTMQNRRETQPYNPHGELNALIASQLYRSSVIAG